MSAPDAPTAIPAEGWYPDPWLASQQRYWNGEWTAWTAWTPPAHADPLPPPRNLGALDSFTVTAAFIMSLAGGVAFFAGINPAGFDPPSPSGVYPQAFNHPALSIAGATAAACGVILSVFALCHLRNTEGNRHDLLLNLAKAGAIVPVAAFGCLVLYAMAVVPW